MTPYAVRDDGLCGHRAQPSFYSFFTFRVWKRFRRNGRRRSDVGRQGRCRRDNAESKNASRIRPGNKRSRGRRGCVFRPGAHDTTALDNDSCTLVRRFYVPTRLSRPSRRRVRRDVRGERNRRAAATVREFLFP